MNEGDELDRFHMALIEKRNRQRLIERGIRHDPLQKSYFQERKTKKKKKKKKRKS